MAVNKKVFINCPYDKEYLVLLKPLLFSIVYLGYEPVLASQFPAKNRIDRIIGSMKNVNYIVHDFSRCRQFKVPKSGRSFGYNTAFEFGIYKGIESFSEGVQKEKNEKNEKKTLVMTDKEHSHKKYFSDIEGIDCKSHGNKPKKIVQIVRSWFFAMKSNGNSALAEIIWTAYNKVNTDVAGDGYSKSELDDLSTYVTEIKKRIKLLKA